MKKIAQDGLPDSFSLAELARIQGSKEAPYMRSVWIHVNDNQVSIEEYDGSLNETLRRDGAERVFARVNRLLARILEPLGKDFEVVWYSGFAFHRVALVSQGQVLY